MITAGATILGALVAFISTRASDRRRAKREEQDRIKSDSREAAVEFIEACRHIEHMASLQQAESRAMPSGSLLEATFDATINLENAWSRFEVYGDKDAIAAGRPLMIAALLINIPDHNPRAAAKYRGEFITARYEFLNVIRKNTGLSLLAVPKYTPIVKEDFMEQYGEIIESYGEALLNRFGPMERSEKGGRESGEQKSFKRDDAK